MPFDLTIVSPDGIAFREEVDSVVLPGTDGNFGVLESHERLLTSLRVGLVEIVRGNETVRAAVSSGFAEVQGRAVTVLVDACELSDEIDTSRAEIARERAERALEELRESKEESERIREYEENLERAITRITVADRH